MPTENDLSDKSWEKKDPVPIRKIILTSFWGEKIDSLDRTFGLKEYVFFEMTLRIGALNHSYHVRCMLGKRRSLTEPLRSIDGKDSKKTRHGQDAMLLLKVIRNLYSFPVR